MGCARHDTRSLRRRSAWIIGLLAVLLASGCTRNEADFHLMPDGSGYADFVVTLLAPDEDVEAILAEALRIMFPGAFEGKPGETNEFVRELFEEEGEGGWLLRLPMHLHMLEEEDEDEDPLEAFRVGYVIVEPDDVPRPQEGAGDALLTLLAEFDHGSAMALTFEGTTFSNLEFRRIPGGAQVRGRLTFPSLATFLRRDIGVQLNPPLPPFRFDESGFWLDYSLFSQMAAFLGVPESGDFRRLPASKAPTMTPAASSNPIHGPFRYMILCSLLAMREDHYRVHLPWPSPQALQVPLARIEEGSHVVEYRFRGRDWLPRIAAVFSTENELTWSVAEGLLPEAILDHQFHVIFRGEEDVLHVPRPEGMGSLRKPPDMSGSHGEGAPVGLQESFPDSQNGSGLRDGHE